MQKGERKTNGDPIVVKQGYKSVDMTPNKYKKKEVSGYLI